MPAAVPHASACEPLCDDTLQTAVAVLRDAISFLFSFGYRLSFFAETPNQSSAAFAGSFAPILRLEKLEIHKVFLRFSSLVLCQNLSPNALPIDSEFPNISSKPFGIWAKNSENTLRRSFFCVAVIPAICGRCAPKRNPAETCPADMAILPEIVKA